MALVLALAFRGRLRLLPLARGARRRWRSRSGSMRAGRRAADDGLDRRAAGAARPRRRLRDPVPGARATSGGARRGRARGRCRRSPPRRSPRSPASSCCCSRPCRWSRASGCCSCSASARASLLALTGGHGRARARRAPARQRRRCARSLRGAGELRGARELARRAPLAAAGPRRRARRRRVLGARRSRAPGRVLAVALLAAACAGWAADTQTEVVSDLTRSSRRTWPRCATSTTLQATTGVAGEVDVVVEAATSPTRRSSAGCARYQSGCSQAHGTRRAGCGGADLCPALSLPDLFRGAGAPTTPRGCGAAGRRAAVLLAGRDHRRPPDGEPRVRHPADAARRAAGDHRRHAPPARPAAGRDARLAGLPVLAAEANAKLVARAAARHAARRTARGRRSCCSRVYRRWAAPGCRSSRSRSRRAGRRWCSSLLRIPLNPMSATLGALVIAISTEFAVLLAARFREERARGPAGREALRAHVRAPRARRCSPRARRRSPASPCSRSPTCGCCATSGR